MWKKIQTLGSAVDYDNDSGFALQIRYLFALAFLPSEEIPQALDSFIPDKPHELVQEFRRYYVLGPITKIQRMLGIIKKKT